MDSDLLVFGLALGGYTLLGAGVVLQAGGIRARPLSIVTSVVVTLHVVGVWWHRFDWQLAEALGGGVSGFILFHAAFAAVLAGPLAPPHHSRWLVYAAFAVVTAGAVGAVFRHEFMLGFRYPVLLVAIVSPSLALLLNGRQ